MLFHSNGLPILGAGVNIEGNKGLLSSVKERDAMWVYKRLMVLWLVTGSVTIGAEALDTPPGLITQWVRSGHCGFGLASIPQAGS